MGNYLGKQDKDRQIDALLNDDLKLTRQVTLAEGRFLTSVHCITTSGHAVVKVYYKRGEKEGDLEVHRRVIANYTEKIQSKLDCPNLAPYAFTYESPKAAYLVRQFCATTVKERINTRPGVTAAEKKWFAFQMLNAVKQLHTAKLTHGDITLENFLVTSERWVYLADFAPFKPVALRTDDAASFGYYFDMGDTKRCYLAPERFYDTMKSTTPVTAVTPAMDIFALGCCIAEMWLNGRAFLSYQDCLDYRTGSLKIESRLEKIDDEGIRDMVRHMVQWDPNTKADTGPNARAEAERYLKDYSFPAVFESFFTIVVFALPLTPDEKVYMLASQLSRLISGFRGCQEANGQLISVFETKRHQFASHDRRSQTITGRSRISQEFSDTQGTSTALSDSSSGGTARSLLGRIQDIASALDETDRSHVNRGMAGSVALDDNKIQARRKAFKSVLELFTTNRVPYPTLVAKHPVISDHMKQREFEILLDEIQRDSRSLSKYLVNARVVTVLNILMAAELQKHGMQNERFDHDQLRELLATTQTQTESATGKCTELEGVVILTPLVFATIRHLEWPSSRILALNILEQLSFVSSDLVRVQRMVPYVMALLSDTEAIVRARAIEVLTQIMCQVTTLVPGEANLFGEYIFPDMLTEIENEQSEVVLCAFARSLGNLAEISLRFLHLAQATLPTEQRVKSQTEEESEGSSDYDAKLLGLRKHVSAMFDALFVIEISAVKRTLFENITPLCTFFGWAMTCNVIIIQMVSVLNNFDDWELRLAFFEKIPALCLFLGRPSTEELIFPCLQAKIADPEELVVLRAVECMTRLCDLKLFSKPTMSQVAESVAPLLCHPNSWIRFATVGLFATLGRILDRIDVFTLVAPLLSEFLVDPILDVSEQSLLAHLYPPMSRITFDRAVQSGVKEGEESDQRLFNTMLGPYLDKAHKQVEALYAATQQTQGARPAREDVQNVIRYLFTPEDSGRSEQWERKIDEVNNAVNLEAVDWQSDVNSANTVPGNHSASSKWKSEVRMSSNKLMEESVLGKPYKEHITADPQQTERTWRPKGLLMMQLSHHTESVTQLAVAHKHKFFASASRDGSVKLWTPEQIAKRENNGEPMLSHITPQGSPVSCIALDAMGFDLACASDKGDVSIFRVDEVTEPIRVNSSMGMNMGSTYTNGAEIQQQRLQLNRQVDVKESGRVQAMFLSSSCLLMVTEYNTLRAWDRRAQSDAIHLPLCPPLHMGLVKDMLVDHDRHWVTLGTSLGFMLVFDMRFRVIAKAWRHPRNCPIQHLSAFTFQKPTPSVGPLVAVAGKGAGAEACGVWDLATGQQHWSFQTLRDDSGELVQPAPLEDCDVFASGYVRYAANTDAYSHLEGTGRNGYPHHTRAMFMTKSLPVLLTAGTDRTLRFWDLEKPQNSYQVVAPFRELNPQNRNTRVKYAEEQIVAKENGAKKSGEEKLDGKKGNEEQSSGKSWNIPTRIAIEQQIPDTVFNSKSLHKPTRIGNNLEDPVSTAHRNCVTDIASITHTDQNRNRYRLLITAGRDGVIKVFK
eukprot:c16641_g1_i1.p1 GENE.c16641_g1_i1~~c16641_g1_i1.p1  ORF type:complete len:1535 (+),score=394.03 c16641_g1_i1:52-4656(+)